MTPPILFITGTDTGVGKTMTAALLAGAFTACGARAHVMKPIETGCPAGSNGGIESVDGRLLWELSGRVQSLAEVAPHRFVPPVSPHLAAREAGVVLERNALSAQITAAAAGAEVMIVEGAGGFLVPLNDQETFADLAQSLGASVIVVVASRLGALNHSLLTFEAIMHRALPLLGYVLSEPLPREDQPHLSAEASNREALSALAAGLGVGELYHLPHLGCPVELETLRTLARSEPMTALAARLLQTLSRRTNS